MSRLVTALVVFLSASQLVGAADWYAAPDGTPAGQGTPASPWDIVSALAGKRKIAAGDTLWLQKGTYKRVFENVGRGFPVKLAGTAEAPIYIRGAVGERVTIDGGLDVQTPATYLWIRDLEILVSEPRPDKPVPPDPSYKNVNRPWGGLTISSGAGCKFINLVIHDNCQGVSWWSGSTDSEMHGCLIYDNGWAGTDRGHGHAIYTQNEKSIRTISDCIMTGGFGYTMHAYGSSRAFVDNFVIEGNIAYSGGTFLVGSGKPSKNIRVSSNVLYGLSMQIGYNAPHNEDCEVRGNLIVSGGLSINKYQKAVKEDNIVLGKSDARPKGSRVIMRLNKYDSDRANLAVFSWEKKGQVTFDAGKFLKPGDQYRLLHPRDFFGKPALTGKYDGKELKIPVLASEKRGFREVFVPAEFAAFVLVREPARK